MLAPEGDCHTHWSTPDKVAHKAMWLWDSCFHAIGRQVVEPELAWEFLRAMLASAAADGHVPIRREPWTGQPWTGGTPSRRIFASPQSASRHFTSKTKPFSLIN